MPPTCVTTVEIAAGRLIARRLKYFVSLFGPNGRESANIVVHCSDDARVVSWATKLVSKRMFAKARIERKGSILPRSR
jgi:hypothetical protein